MLGGAEDSAINTVMHAPPNEMALMRKTTKSRRQISLRTSTGLSCSQMP